MTERKNSQSRMTAETYFKHLKDSGEGFVRQDIVEKYSNTTASEWLAMFRKQGVLETGVDPITKEEVYFLSEDAFLPRYDNNQTTKNNSLPNFSTEPNPVTKITNSKPKLPFPFDQGIKTDNQQITSEIKNQVSQATHTPWKKNHKKHL